MNNELRIPSFGTGYAAYEAAKQWISSNMTHLTAEQYAQACRLAARMAGV